MENMFRQKNDRRSPDRRQGETNLHTGSEYRSSKRRDYADRRCDPYWLYNYYTVVYVYTVLKSCS